VTVNILNDIFPKAITEIRNNNSGQPRKFVNKPDVKVSKPKEYLVPDANINIFEGKLDPYKNKLKDIQFKAEKATMKQLADSITKVSQDAFKCKFNNNHLLFFEFKIFKY
jgi:hypothetical protein